MYTSEVHHAGYCCPLHSSFCVCVLWKFCARMHRLHVHACAPCTYFVAAALGCCYFAIGHEHCWVLHQLHVAHFY
jgi:hypothetical protein